MTTYLGSKLMRATSSSMALASSILEFDIIELWHEDDVGVLKCTYVHAVDRIKKNYPGIITGHYPAHSKEHRHSPELCGKAKLAPKGIYWSILDDPKDLDGNSVAVDANISAPPSLWHSKVSAPIKTEMAFMLDTETPGLRVFIVGFALQAIHYLPYKSKFLYGIGYAIYVAAFDIDEEGDDDDAQQIVNDIELDKKEMHQPRVRSNSFSEFIHVAEEAAAEANLLVMTAMTMSQDEVERDRLVYAAPTWPTYDPFAYPISNIPVVNQVRNDYRFESFLDIRHVADGSNSNIYLGVLSGQRVIIKMMKETVKCGITANVEFDVEHGLLCRLNHRSVIKLLGAGSSPRRFLVLEYLEGGALSHKLTYKNPRVGLAGKMFKKPLFTYPVLLNHAKSLAEAMNYLHTEIHDGAMIIHRDLKPDNIGFSADGTLKLFDFGLCSLVNQRTSPEEAYAMTGNTGSLRYMAPEVARQVPYTEKVDVYSYGIVVWQMARDKLPFKGLSRDDFAVRVVGKHERPKLDKSWPQGFTDLLAACWHKDAEKRPSFHSVIESLQRLLDSEKAMGSVTPGTPVVPKLERKGSWLAR